MSWTWGIFMGLGSKAHTDCLIVLRALGVSRAVRGGGADMAALEGFTYPEFWNFPPFFTIQPVEDTRNKQLQVWSKFILDWAKSTQTWVFAPAAFPLWENKAIGRRMNGEGQRQVIAKMVRDGNAVWESEEEQSGRLRVLWKTVEEVANDLYTYATAENMLGSVYTIYELHSGEDSAKSPFHQMDPWVLRKAIELLEEQGKATLFESDKSSAEGVKFY